MLENEIQNLQAELNGLIEEGVDYQKIYEASVKLDKLIVQYYIRLKQDNALPYKSV